MIEFKTKNKGIQFKIGKSVHMIPSKEFPLATNRTRDIIVFNRENTKEVINERVIDVFNNYEYKLGRCFQNAEGLRKALKKEGILGWEYYSGWMFTTGGYPLFHSWLSKDEHILEYTNYFMSKDIADKLKEAKNQEEFRTIFAKEQASLNKLPNNEAKTCGKCHQEYMYIGMRDTFENSIRIFQSLDKSHISYQAKGMNMEGSSRLQEEIEELNR